MSQQINLYEIRLRPRNELAIARNLGIAALALLLLMTTMALWARFDADRKSTAAAVSQKQVAAEQERLTALSNMVAQRQVSPALASELEIAKATLSVRSDVVAMLDSGTLGNTSGFSALMSGFARHSQSDLWLTGFLLTAGGTEIEIRGRLLDPSRLPAYVQRLRSEPVFQGRRFAALEMRGVDPGEENTPSPGTAKVSATVVPSQSVPGVPRFVEFVLRSENVDAADVSPRSGVNR
ncbi:MAG: hypothetical protein JNM42_06875 [Propionivibrio sp.]|uniref:hypothetical protein n=1 Tax=Propionivibrio sp. TaxID=2212460 RepID=UPI001A3C51E7|nr:hypothetical protein [Propionivibrio sp.]MBL8414142.1 hypothetical protein [Propionivibrio sp.]